MEPPAIAGILIGTVAVFYLASDRGSAAVESAWTAYFRGFRTDPWPRGVQEEYFDDHRWGSAAASVAETPQAGIDDLGGRAVISTAAVDGRVERAPRR